MNALKHSKYIRLDMSKELKKARSGKPTKLPVELVLYESLRGYPAIQRKLAKAFDISVA
jgi:hypothetical protein